MARQGARIYHITHVDNLAGIVETGGLQSDSVRAAKGASQQVIGMQTIKRRRMSVPVPPHPGTVVADYVPFYFCPRSVMLFVIHCANNPELAFRGGQSSIVHLSVSVDLVVEWAQRQGKRWAFSFANAATAYTRFSNEPELLGELDWAAIGARDFRGREVKEAKQAEFLVHEFFPVELFDLVGVCDARTSRTATDVLRVLPNPPTVEVRPRWYY